MTERRAKRAVCRRHKPIRWQSHDENACRANDAADDNHAIRRDPLGHGTDNWGEDNDHDRVDPGEFARALNAGRVDRAVDILENLSNSAPNQPGFPALATQLLVFRADGTNKANLARATALGQRAITANPEAPDGWISEAMVLDWDKKPQAALGYALRAKDLSPKDPMVLTILA